MTVDRALEKGIAALSVVIDDRMALGLKPGHVAEAAAVLESLRPFVKAAMVYGAIECGIGPDKLPPRQVAWGDFYDAYRTFVAPKGEKG